MSQTRNRKPLEVLSIMDARTVSAPLVAKVKQKARNIMRTIGARTGWNIRYSGDTEIHQENNYIFITAYHIDCWAETHHKLHSANFPLFVAAFAVQTTMKDGARRARTAAVLFVFDGLTNLHSKAERIMSDKECTALRVFNFHIGSAEQWFIDKCVEIIKASQARTKPIYISVNFDTHLRDFANFLTNMFSTALNTPIVFTYTTNLNVFNHKITNPTEARTDLRTTQLGVINDKIVVPTATLTLIATFTSAHLQSFVFNIRIDIEMRKQESERGVLYAYAPSLMLYHETATVEHRYRTLKHPPVKSARELNDALKVLFGKYKRYLTKPEQQRKLRELITDAYEAERVVRSPGGDVALASDSVVKVILEALTHLVHKATVTCVSHIMGGRASSDYYIATGYKTRTSHALREEYRNYYSVISIHPVAKRAELAELSYYIDVNVDFDYSHHSSIAISVQGRVTEHFGDSRRALNFRYADWVSALTLRHVRWFVSDLCEQFADAVLARLLEDIAPIVATNVREPLILGFAPVVKGVKRS